MRRRTRSRHWAAWAAVACCAALCATLAGERPATGMSPVRTFYCWFPEKGSRVGDRCDQVLAEAVRTWRWYGEPQVVVAGHATDGDGADGNNRLGAARAAAVAGRLFERGVPGRALEVVTYGGERMMVPDDPPNEQNRRVEIGWRWPAVGPRPPVP